MTVCGVAVAWAWATPWSGVVHLATPLPGPHRPGARSPPNVLTSLPTALPQLCGGREAAQCARGYQAAESIASDRVCSLTSGWGVKQPHSLAAAHFCVSVRTNRCGCSSDCGERHVRGSGGRAGSKEVWRPPKRLQIVYPLDAAPAECTKSSPPSRKAAHRTRQRQHDRSMCSAVVCAMQDAEEACIGS